MRGLEVLDASGVSSDAAADQAVVDLEVRHGQALFGFVRRQGLTDVEAQDAVQDVLFRLWLELRSGTAIESPRAWAYRSVYRIAMDHHRLRTRVAALARRLDAGRREPSASDATDRVAVWAEVERLPERQRQVLYLRYRADLPFEEIGPDPRESRRARRAVTRRRRWPRFDGGSAPRRSGDGRRADRARAASSGPVDEPAYQRGMRARIGHADDATPERQATGSTDDGPALASPTRIDVGRRAGARTVAALPPATLAQLAAVLAIVVVAGSVALPGLVGRPRSTEAGDMLDRLRATGSIRMLVPEGRPRPS